MTVTEAVAGAIWNRDRGEMFEKCDTGTESDHALLFQTYLRSHEKQKSKAGAAPRRFCQKRSYSVHCIVK